MDALFAPDSDYAAVLRAQFDALYQRSLPQPQPPSPPPCHVSWDVLDAQCEEEEAALPPPQAPQRARAGAVRGAPPMLAELPPRGTAQRRAAARNAFAPRPPVVAATTRGAARKPRGRQPAAGIRPPPDHATLDADAEDGERAAYGAAADDGAAASPQCAPRCDAGDEDGGVACAAPHTAVSKPPARSCSRSRAAASADSSDVSGGAPSPSRKRARTLAASPAAQTWHQPAPHAAPGALLFPQAPPALPPALLGTCSICWEPISAAAAAGASGGGSSALCELRPCEHLYHEGCIAPWLAAQSTCPQCRVRVRARWGAASGLVVVPRAETLRQQLLADAGRLPYDDTVCQVCHDGGAEDVMLLCDGCDKGFHTHCVQLRAVPRGVWHCRRCRRARLGVAGLAMGGAVMPPRRSIIDLTLE